MIGLSVAVGRFIEALFWAILRVAGSIAAFAVLGLFVLAAAVIVVRWMIRRRRRGW